MPGEHHRGPSHELYQPTARRCAPRTPPFFAPAHLFTLSIDLVFLMLSFFWPTASVSASSKRIVSVRRVISSSSRVARFSPSSAAACFHKQHLKKR